MKNKLKKIKEETSKKDLVIASLLIILTAVGIFIVQQNQNPSNDLESQLETPPQPETPDNISNGEISLNDQHLKTGIEMPDPEKQLTVEENGWCVQWTPDGCVKMFDSREEAKEYIMS